MARPGRPKGLPKTGGRKPGTPNKRTEDLAERLAAAMGADWCPIVAMARIAADPKTSLEMRVRCLSEVAPYVQPKRKAVEHSAGKTLEELVLGTRAEQLKAARERVANGRGTTPKTTAGTSVTEPAQPPAANSTDVEPATASPVETPEPQPAAPVHKPPPRLTAITNDMSPVQTPDFDPYA